MEENQVSIHSVRRIHGCAVLTLSTGETLCMPRAMLKERPYRGGMPFDREAFERLLRERSYSYAMEKAVSLLALRPRSERELSTALAQCAYSEAVIARVMAYLTEAGYVCDGDFAKQWMDARMNRSMGTRRIQMELRQKGIDTSVIEQTLSTVPEEALLDGALNAVRKAGRVRNLSEPAEKRRTMAMLARRGYDYTTARQAIDAWLTEE